MGLCEILFRDAWTKLHNEIQFINNISRRYQYNSSTDEVSFDRAPDDYLAYSQHTSNQGTTDIDDVFVESLVPAARESPDHLDIQAFAPKPESWLVAMEEDGIRPVDHAYRDEADEIFKQI